MDHWGIVERKSRGGGWLRTFEHPHVRPPCRLSPPKGNLFHETREEGSRALVVGRGQTVPMMTLRQQRDWFENRIVAHLHRLGEGTLLDQRELFAQVCVEVILDP